MLRRSLRVAVVLGLLAALLSAAPAAASVPDLVVISEQTANDSSDPKTLVATCPASSPVLLSAGYRASGLGDALIDDVVFTANSVTVSAYESDPDYLPNWRLSVHAVCADPLPDLSLITAEARSESPDFASLSLTCPTGDVLLGGGFAMNGSGELEVDDLRPNGGAITAPTALFVGAFEADPYAVNWWLRAYATCADPVAGLHRVSDSTASVAIDRHELTVTCDVGEVLVGSGYELLGGGAGEVIVDSVEFDGDETTAPTSVEVEAFREDDFQGFWSLAVYAICADA